jgi:hypothetical protein
MRTPFIDFFVEVAQQKLKVKYSIVKMILHTLPHVKSAWKEFKQEAESLSLEVSMEKYPGIEVREHRFIHFIESGHLTEEEMIQVMQAHQAIDLRHLHREYAYTEEELRYYLKSRLMNRMVSKIDKLDNAIEIQVSERLS